MQPKLFTKIIKFFKNRLSPLSKSKEEVVFIPITEDFERCVMCGKLTDIPVTTPIQLREFYEIGCGQLCENCYKTLQIEMNTESRLSNERIMLAVAKSIKETKKNSL